MKEVASINESANFTHPQNGPIDTVSPQPKAGSASRNKILSAVKNNQPQLMELPAIQNFPQNFSSITGKFSEVLKGIGGSVFEVNDHHEVLNILKNQFSEAKRIVSTVPELSSLSMGDKNFDDAHSLEDVDLAVISSSLGVAENGSVWITEGHVPQRVLPFICQHLAVLLQKKDLVSSMHEAYDVIGNADYGFGVFIAGPSKTADIEQSLVLGAHGPKSMTVFLID
jgi:L-lactate dehydrogenase complex protein LldG